MAKILVADDNSNIQKMVGLALKDQGIDVVAVGNGEAAVRKISDLRPDLVLADVFMPVRNGYEVCRYVKEEPSLAHIPVILLVGAFDPLDEQEAQRSGADGVLKKPFVPPDPLISMVKSALTRAGIAVGPAPSAEKPAALPKRSGGSILEAAVSSKLAAMSPEPLPEVTPEPLEEFPTEAPTQHLKIAAGQEPLAFGSLLETPQAEEDVAVTSKPMIELRKWDEEPDEVEEEKEEEGETPRGGWQPSALEEVEHAAAPSKVTADWRDEAFHGSSPAQSPSKKSWSQPGEATELVEAAELPSVAVATVTRKPTETPVPFGRDAWASAVAADVEKKIAEVKDIVTAKSEAETLQHSDEHLPATLPAMPVLEASSVQAAPTVAPEPSNWATVPETAWELEAKKASLLASTWDTPQATEVQQAPEEQQALPPVDLDATQDVPVYTAEEPALHHRVEPHAEEVPSAYSGESLMAHEHTETPAEEPAAAETAPEPALQATETKSWESRWEAPKVAPVVPPLEETHLEAPHAQALQSEPALVEEHPAVAAPIQEAAATEPAPADMDELVAKVLQKMNPDVLQKVTREILRPVIEAIVRDEINSKKS